MHIWIELSAFKHVRIVGVFQLAMELLFLQICRTLTASSMALVQHISVSSDVLVFVHRPPETASKSMAHEKSTISCVQALSLWYFSDLDKWYVVLGWGFRIDRGGVRDADKGKAKR